MVLADILEAAITLVTDLGLLPFITVAAVVGAAMTLYARAARGSK